MRIAVGMSGGIDSAVAVALLQQQGHKVLGLTMQLWDGSLDLPPAEKAACYSADEPQRIEKTKALASRLGVELHCVPLAEIYKREVLEYFCAEYNRGRTPNPCVRCNQAIKFGALLAAAEHKGLKLDAFATGHYARVSYNQATDRYELKRARDRDKDQSYFLARLTQKQLSRVIFPLAEYTKKEIYQLAADFGLQDLLQQPESQDFLGNRDYTAIFKAGKAGAGPIMNSEGRILGAHTGIANYTIGQRKGLNLGGLPVPYYVVSLDAEKNAVIAGEKNQLFSQSLVVSDLNWIAFPQLAEPTKAEVKIRYRAKSVPAMLLPLETSPESSVKVIFETPQSAVTPGQAAVFYQADLVLGSGWINQAQKAE